MTSKGYRRDSPASRFIARCIKHQTRLALHQRLARRVEPRPDQQHVDTRRVVGHVRGIVEYLDQIILIEISVGLHGFFLKAVVKPFQFVIVAAVWIVKSAHLAEEDVLVMG